MVGPLWSGSLGRMTVSGAAIRTEALTGWGRTMSTVATVVPAIHENEMANYIREASSRGVLARGLGRSYGDAAQSGGATVFDMTTYNNFSLDQATMTAHRASGRKHRRHSARDCSTRILCSRHRWNSHHYCWWCNSCRYSREKSPSRRQFRRACFRNHAA